jgi:hypothetical protein
MVQMSASSAEEFQLLPRRRVRSNAAAIHMEEFLHMRGDRDNFKVRDRGCGMVEAMEGAPMHESLAVEI